MNGYIVFYMEFKGVVNYNLKAHRVRQHLVVRKHTENKIKTCTLFMYSLAKLSLASAIKH